MNGELRVVEDVPGRFAALVAARCAALHAERPARRIRLGCSGGTSGAACWARVAREEIDWPAIECYFADERCVEAGSEQRNAVAIAEALGARLGALAGYHPMDCAQGPEAYEAQLREAGGLDLLQLGLGPDGHCASLFPGSPALAAPPTTLVAVNRDPSGTNPHDRLTLTYAGIRSARCVVVTVIGAARAPALRALLAGEDLPAGRLDAPELIWLIDAAVAEPAGLRLSA